MSHLDALWDLADNILGPERRLTPAEGFVFGGAVLLHDLGHASAAYVDGVKSARQEPFWTDALTQSLQKRLGRPPSPDEIENASEADQVDTTRLVLRELHARMAERLASIAWVDEKGAQQYLLEDSELRASYGPLMGRIAHSHWWSVGRLVDQFSTPLGAPGWLPSRFTVDPLKIACLLRCCDAAHLDARRAPHFLRVLRNPSVDSQAHWVFQQKLVRPELQEDQLRFTATEPFDRTESTAWWLAKEALEQADRELRDVDEVNLSYGRQRFAARGVVAVGDARRLSRLIPTTDWVPVDTRVRVSNVAALVERVGGAELYGNHAFIGLRELIQNGSDALQARMLIDEMPVERAELIVELGADADGEWLEVRDNGVGMRPDVMTGPLLDFGNSYWATLDAARSFPHLFARGFSPTGRYGIGFFSSFMLGDEVTVSSRDYRAGRDATMVLEFAGGMDAPPLLRNADEGEYVADGGSRVRVRLRGTAEEVLGLRNFRMSLATLCGWLCPALPITLTVAERGEASQPVIANDWERMDADALLKRHSRESNLNRDVIARVAKNVLPIRGPNGVTIGRAAVIPAAISAHVAGRRDLIGLVPAVDSTTPTLSIPNAVISVGGLRAAEAGGLAGVVLGRTTRVSRDAAEPLVDEQALAEWATRQADIVEELDDNPWRLSEVAGALLGIGGHSGRLPLALVANKWLSFEEIVQWARDESYVAVALVRSRRPRNLVPWLSEPWLVFPPAHVHPLPWKVTPQTYGVDSSWRSDLGVAGFAAARAIAEGWGVPLAEFLPADKAVRRELESEIGFSEEERFVVATFSRPTP